MSYELPGASAPREVTCRYGASKLHFRGPARSFDLPYLACVGGTETFGRFVTEPFPALLEKRLGEPCVNLGSVNGGLDSILNDPEIPKLAKAAEICLLQVPGAHSLSNDMYRVHPRRNDRFVEASIELSELYGEVDFTEFHFTRHMLGRLARLSPERFEIVEHALKRAWRKRMAEVLDLLGPNIILVWLRYTATHPDGVATGLGAEPLMVEATMLRELGSSVVSTVEFQVKTASASDELGDMIFGTLQEPAAEHMLGPATHQVIADQLFRHMRDLDI